MTLLRRAKAVETKLERAVSSVADGASPRIKVASTAFPDSPKSAHRCGVKKLAQKLTRHTMRKHAHGALAQVAAQHAQAAEGAQRAADTAGGSTAEVQVRRPCR